MEKLINEKKERQEEGKPNDGAPFPDLLQV